MKKVYELAICNPPLEIELIYSHKKRELMKKAKKINLYPKSLQQRAAVCEAPDWRAERYWLSKKEEKRKNKKGGW